jgi:hypothetical protein
MRDTCDTCDGQKRNSPIRDSRADRPRILPALPALSAAEGSAAEGNPEQRTQSADAKCGRKWTQKTLDRTPKPQTRTADANYLADAKTCRMRTPTFRLRTPKTLDRTPKTLRTPKTTEFRKTKNMARVADKRSMNESPTNPGGYL